MKKNFYIFDRFEIVFLFDMFIFYLHHFNKSIRMVMLFTCLYVMAYTLEMSWAFLSNPEPDDLKSKPACAQKILLLLING